MERPCLGAAWLRVPLESRHAFEYSIIGQATEYRPPAVAEVPDPAACPDGATCTVYDIERRIDQVVQADGQLLDLPDNQATGPLTSVTFTRSSALGNPFKAALSVYSPTDGTTVEFDTFAAGVNATDFPVHNWPAVVPGALSPQRTIVRLGGQRSNAADNPTSWVPPNPATNVRVQDIPNVGGSRTLHVGDDLNAGAATGTSSAARASVQYTVAIYTT